LARSRRRRSHDLARRDVRIPWEVAGGGRVCPTGVRRRVAGRWRRVRCILERAIGEAARRRKEEEMRVRKAERLNRREGDRRTRGGGSQRKGLETLNVEKKKQSRENIPQRMHQTVNG